MSEQNANTGDRGRQRGSERRAAARRGGGGLAVTLRINGASHLVEIMDISELGFQAETTVSLHAGQPVEVDLPGVGGVRAVVRWGVGPYLGVEFDRPIDMKAVTASS